MLFFSACLLSLAGKGLALASPFVEGVWYNYTYSVCGEKRLLVIATTFATIFLPGFLLAIASCWHRGILKTFLAHPSIILLPTFTHFTFASSITTKWFKGILKKEEDENKEENQEKTTGEAEEPFVTFSASCTLLNALLSVVGSVAYCLSITYINESHVWRGIPYHLKHYLYFWRDDIPFILVPILGLLLTIFSLALNSNCSCPLPGCFSLPRIEYGVLNPSKPYSHFVLDAKGKPRLVPETEDAEVYEMNEISITDDPETPNN